MQFDTCISELEGRARAKGLYMGAACKLAGIHPNTFSRWRQGKGTATLKLLSKLESAIDQYENKNT